MRIDAFVAVTIIVDRFPGIYTTHNTRGVCEIGRSFAHMVGFPGCTNSIHGVQFYRVDLFYSLLFFSFLLIFVFFLQVRSICSYLCEKSRGGMKRTAYDQSEKLYGYHFHAIEYQFSFSVVGKIRLRVLLNFIAFSYISILIRKVSGN